MSSNIFFEKKNIRLNKLFPSIKFKNNFIVSSIKPLKSAKKDDISFLDSLKYKSDALNTKSVVCLTTEKLAKFFPVSVQTIVVKNVLFEISKILKNIYPLADIDYPDKTLKPVIKKKYKSVKFSNNVLVGNNVKIGKNSFIGANSIIEHDVKIGNNCIIGSHVILKNSIVGIK